MPFRIIAVLLVWMTVNALAAECPYPKKPINWILRYCSMKVETDDETIIQNSDCFKSAKNDVLASDVCKMNEKYKMKVCDEFMMESKKYKSLQECLADEDITPYVSG